MKRFIQFGLFSLFALSALTFRVEGSDRDRDRDRDWDKHHDRDHEDRSRTIYFVEHDRPVQRVVYITPDGRYYRIIDGQRVFVKEKYYESYPSRFYTPDGHRRAGVTITF